MSANPHLDGVLIEWGERLFYPRNRIVKSHTPQLQPRPHATQDRAAAVRARIEATVRRAPQVMVKVTGGGRGMGAIAAHFRYISKGGRLDIEDDRGVVERGKDAVREIERQWQFGGARIEREGHRREAFNIMLSMPRGTDPLTVQHAAREFAKIEFADHRYVMVLHEHQANPHVHLSVKAESKHGQRLNPRKADLQRWRETFAERLRERGIDAEATRQATRGSRHRNERVWERKPVRRGTTRGGQAPARLSPSHRDAGEAWARIAQALTRSPEAADRELGQSVVRYVHEMPVVKALIGRSSPQRELPGMAHKAATPARRGPEIER